MSPPYTNRQLADILFDSIETNDFVRLGEVYTPETIIWHNADQAEKLLADYVTILQQFRQCARDWKYTTVRHIDIEDGFVRQMLVQGHTRGGHVFGGATCLVCTTKNGKITRIDEYFDTAGTTALFEEVAHQNSER